MNRYIRFVTGAAIALFTSANVLMAELGRIQTPPAALDGFGDACAAIPQPCWNGIIPGQTTIDETRRIMAYAGSGVTLFDDLTESYVLYFIPPRPTPLCMILFQMDETIVSRLQLQVCKEANVKVGDLTATLGVPGRLIVVPPQNLVYEGVSITIEGWRARMLPTSRVSFISLLRPTARRRPFFDWHGFVPEWRYCQLEPNYPLCPG